jgi:hypothetical protein
MSEERGFEVRDRRRVHADGEASGEDAASADAADAGMASHGFAEEPTGEDAGDTVGMPDVSVDGILAWTVGMLANIAWSRMGLIADPMTGQMARDLPEARRAIDAVADLVKHLEPTASPADRRELQNMLSDLRVNFVQQSTRKD